MFHHIPVLINDLEWRIRMNKKIVAVVVVVILAAAALMGGIVLMNNDKSSSSEKTYAGEVKIFGNANNDDKIDEEDVKVLEKLMKDGYSEKDYPFADSNRDGKITQQDIDIVNKVIKGEKTTLYYVNYFGDVRTVHFPITGSVGVNFWQQAELMACIGAWDKVTAVDSQTIVRTAQYPGIEKCFDLGKRDAMTAERILASGISALVCHGNASSTTESLIKDFEGAGKTIDIICLGWEGMNCLSTAIMMGIFMKCEDGAYKYVDWCNKILGNIESKLSKLSNDEIATIIVPLMYANQSKNIRIECEGTGSYSLISRLGNVIDLPDATYETKNRADRSVEWFMEENSKGTFDYIMIMEEGTGTGATLQTYNDRFEYSLTFLDKTQAYKEGRIGGTTYGFGGFSGFSLLTYAAYMVYPDLFTKEEGIQAMQDWYDTFTFMDIDVSDKGWRYTGTAYKEYNDRLNG